MTPAHLPVMRDRQVSVEFTPPHRAWLSFVDHPVPSWLRPRAAWLADPGLMFLAVFFVLPVLQLLGISFCAIRRH